MSYHVPWFETTCLGRRHFLEGAGALAHPMAFGCSELCQGLEWVTIYRLWQFFVWWKAMLTDDEWRKRR